VSRRNGFHLNHDPLPPRRVSHFTSMRLRKKLATEVPQRLAELA
jgi:hypothetical protein